MHVYNEEFIYTFECYTKGNASNKGCVCMYMPDDVGQTMIRQQELYSFASKSGFIFLCMAFCVRKYVQICPHLCCRIYKITLSE